MPQTPPNLKPQTTPDQQRADAPTPMPPRRTWGIFLLILLINFLLFRMLFPSPDMDTVPYTVFKQQDRKSTRLNSSHVAISYAVFCLKKKNNIKTHYTPSSY